MIDLELAKIADEKLVISGTEDQKAHGLSTLDWTFVFKNTGYDAKEARAEITLPKYAVISGMVLWVNGVPKRATIASSETAKQACQWVVGGRKDPALATDLGKGRVLVQCYPIPSGYIVQQYVPTASKKPDHLVVVVDGSAALESHKNEIASQLAKIPSAIPTSLIVASDQYKEGMQFASLKDAVAAMQDEQLHGGKRT